MDDKTLRMGCGCGTKKNDDDGSGDKYVQDGQGVKVEK